MTQINYQKSVTLLIIYYNENLHSPKAAEKTMTKV